METINDEKRASIHFEMKWKSGDAVHTEGFYSAKANMWRDVFPPGMREQLEGLGDGADVKAVYEPGVLTGEHRDSDIFEMPKKKVVPRQLEGRLLKPRSGRFYPKGMLKDIAGIFPQNITPFRLADEDSDAYRIDFNHPLSKSTLVVNAHVENVREKKMEIGGNCNDYGEILTSGPGIQTRWGGRPTNFFADDPFAREDDREDSIFYNGPRFTAHLDSQAIAHVENLYGRLIAPGSKVLDLMSSYHTHIPGDLELNSLIGLGMSAEEMMNNDMLTDYLVHDLNVRPELPFASHEFDSAICNVSVEYMTKPMEVFEEISRVLQPGGLFVVTFSNRWFPPKVVRLWTELHEFERLQLVMEYFRNSGRFEHLETFTERGWSRPMEDRHSGLQKISDPVFAVWGRTKLVH